MKRIFLNTILGIGLLSGSTWLYVGQTQANRPIELPASNIPAARKTHTEPIIYFFTRDDCLYCRPMHRLANQLHQQGHTIYVVDASRQDLVRRYGVSAYPTFLVIEGDTIVRRVIGLTTKERILGQH
ncbi:hypothetical protein C5Y96_10700 [Blastopirellula marina]|uniref:Thioredoxin-like fold domain-containing protein n=1 Tax=Blastopirellula marina TaxID=124 RepID=A0A2S8FM88_9BACT|nr:MULTISPECIES: thioredoxin family protein [Pirellulaceae]PQO33312.1 hypothetical protein C5Y96_10700 [Blastopirellula marina]RCS52401.1 thioredoxin [Bremerella cremea]